MSEINKSPAPPKHPEFMSARSHTFPLSQQRTNSERKKMYFSKALSQLVVDLESFSQFSIQFYSVFQSLTMGTILPTFLLLCVR